jgi:threonine/homoserine/homoserine lactone efflux protein
MEHILEHSGFSVATAVVWADNFAVFTAYAIFAGAARRAIVENRRALNVIRRLLAASFATLGARLAFEHA